LVPSFWQMTDLTLKHAFRYGASILVAFQTLVEPSSDPDVNTFKGSDNTWLKVVETTRNLLGHAGLHHDQSQGIYTAICNTRNLLRLYNIDISDIDTFKDISSEDNSWYATSHANWLSMKDHETLMTELTPISFEQLKVSFESVPSAVKAIFGRAVYSLVATSFTPWTTLMSQYK
jgi:hypothetical protein